MSPIASASSTAAASVVERVRIEKSAYRSFAVTVRPETFERRRRSETSTDSRRISVWRASRSERSLAKVSSAEIETGSPASSRSRASMPRARFRRSGPSAPGSRALRSPSASAASAPIVETPAPISRCLRARPDAGQQAHVERREKSSLPAGRHDGDAGRFPPVRRDLAYHLRGRHAERARQARRRADGSLDGSSDPPRLREVMRNGSEVEISLVDPGPLDPRDDIGDRVPDRA